MKDGERIVWALVSHCLKQTGQLDLDLTVEWPIANHQESATRFLYLDTAYPS